ncbi:hypothetical protein [Oleiharenicola lentus]|uniref:hypothetical protein n=1 Tax=Oleiharenicola lentus TaxID=2508720 RepID=UPI003F6645B3
MLPGYSHTILVEKRTIIQRFSGQVGLGDVIGGINRLWADPAYDRNFNGISDLTACTPSASVSDVRSLTNFVIQKHQLSEGRWVVLVSDPMMTALGILFSRSMTKPSIQVCSTWEAACAYLQITLPAQN